MTKIAVTGGSGFIGSAAIRWGLYAGHEMWTFDRQDGNDVLGDLSDLKGAEAVIHLAGMLGTHELFESKEEAVAVNVLGSLRVMQWCLDNEASYVGILMPDVFPSIYTATKVATHRLANAMRINEGLRVAHVRAFNAYGPGQKHGPGHPQKIIPTFATYGWRDEPMPIFGSGNQSVDLVHVDDVGRMLIDATDWTTDDPDNDKIFDAGTGVALTVRQVAAHVARFTGSKAPYAREGMRLGELETHIVAKGEGWEYLNWRPRHDMDLLRQTVETYRP